jgi:hypothetical protein
VAVMNLYSNYNSSTGKVSSRNQDVLVYLPAPGAAVLGMVGLGALGCIRKKRAAAL